MLNGEKGRQGECHHDKLILFSSFLITALYNSNKIYFWPFRGSRKSFKQNTGILINSVEVVRKQFYIYISSRHKAAIAFF